MRPRIIIGALLLIGVGAFLGGTLLQDQVANARALAQDVFVNNTPANAVPVREQGTVNVQEVRAALQSNSSFDDWGTSAFRNFSFAIPAGKRLILQTVSVRASVEPGQQVRATVTAQGEGLATHSIELVKQGTFDGTDFYVGTEALTAYASGGVGLLATVVRNSTSGVGGRVEFHFSGYLVDI